MRRSARRFLRKLSFPTAQAGIVAATLRLIGALHALGWGEIAGAQGVAGASAGNADANFPAAAASGETLSAEHPRYSDVFTPELVRRLDPSERVYLAESINRGAIDKIRSLSWTCVWPHPRNACASLEPSNLLAESSAANPAQQMRFLEPSLASEGIGDRKFDFWRAQCGDNRPNIVRLGAGADGYDATGVRDFRLYRLDPVDQRTEATYLLWFRGFDSTRSLDIYGN